MLVGMEPRPSLTHSQEKHMTHVLRAHGLFPTAIEAVGRMQQGLCDEMRTAGGDDAFQVWEDLMEVDRLQKALDGGACLTTHQRRVLVAACTLRKGALNVVRPGALAQRVMDDCDKIIELIG